MTSAAEAELTGMLAADLHATKRACAKHVKAEQEQMSRPGATRAQACERVRTRRMGAPATAIEWAGRIRCDHPLKVRWPRWRVACERKGLQM